MVQLSYLSYSNYFHKYLLYNYMHSVVVWKYNFYTNEFPFPISSYPPYSCEGLLPRFRRYLAIVWTLLGHPTWRQTSWFLVIQWALMLAPDYIKNGGNNPYHVYGPIDSLSNPTCQKLPRWVRTYPHRSVSKWKAHKDWENLSKIFSLCG